MDWRVYDVGLATLLTRPDDPVHSFIQLLKRHTTPTVYSSPVLNLNIHSFHLNRVI